MAKKSYCLKIGGFHLSDDCCHPMSEIGVIATYKHLEKKHVKMLWELLLHDTDVQEAYHHFSNAVGKKLGELGDMWVDHKDDDDD